MAEVTCPYPDVKDPSKICDFKGIIEMFNHHVKGWHTKKEDVKEVKKDVKKNKRMEVKPPKSWRRRLGRSSEESMLNSSPTRKEPFWKVRR